MATSGTVAKTVIDTAKLLEHSLRRVKIHPSQQTPEIVQTARENLYLVLTSLANRGLNLWCVERQFVGLQSGQATYEMPDGTIDVLNLVYTQPTRVEGTDTVSANGTSTDLGAATQVVRVGLMASAVTASDMLTISASPDGVTWTSVFTASKTDWATDTWYWFQLPAITTAQFFKAEFATAATLSQFYLATSVYDLPISQWSRDTYAAINNKQMQGRPSTTYYFEKLLTPRVTLWPIPNNSYDHLTVFLHRQAQDVGTLTEQIEVPQRWLESIIWQLSLRLAFELPQVDPALLPVVQQMSERYLIEAEDEEADGAPIFLQPGISVYTR